MLTVEEMRAAVERWVYMPGWEMYVAEGHPEGPELLILASAPNAYHPGTVTPLRIVSLIPPVATVADFARWVGWRLARCAVHESQEFLRDRATGRPLHDPHGEPVLTVQPPSPPGPA